MLLNSVSSCMNPIAWKIRFLDLYLERLTVNHIAGFFDHIYLWMDSIDLIDCLYMDI